MTHVCAHRNSYRSSLSMAGLFLAGSLLVAPASLGRATAATTKVPQGAAKPNKPMKMAMPLVAPLFIENGEFTSNLVLVNAASDNTYADVVLRSARGNTIAQKRVSLLAISQEKVSIADMLLAARSGVTTGSVLVTPSAVLQGMAVAAQLTMTFRKYARPSYVDEEVAMPSMEGSQELHGVADAGDGLPLLSITNLSETSQHVLIKCISEYGPVRMQTLAVAGSATAVLHVCNEDPSNESSEDGIGADDPKHAHHGALGISLKTDGGPGSFSAFAINPHREKHSVVYTSIPFADPKMIISAGTVCVGVPLGETPLLSDSGSYNPVLSMANFGSTATDVSVKLAAASRGSDAVAIATVKTLKLAGNSSVTLELKNLQTSSPLNNSFLVESDAAPGHIGMKLVSYNEDVGLRVEQLDKDEKHPENAGLHPWSLEQGSESTLL